MSTWLSVAIAEPCCPLTCSPCSTSHSLKPHVPAVPGTPNSTAPMPPAPPLHSKPPHLDLAAVCDADLVRPGIRRRCIAHRHAQDLVHAQPPQLVPLLQEARHVLLAAHLAAVGHAKQHGALALQDAKDGWAGAVCAAPPAEAPSPVQHAVCHATSMQSRHGVMPAGHRFVQQPPARALNRSASVRCCPPTLSRTSCRSVRSFRRLRPASAAGDRSSTAVQGAGGGLQATRQRTYVAGAVAQVRLLVPLRHGVKGVVGGSCLRAGEGRRGLPGGGETTTPLGPGEGPQGAGGTQQHRHGEREGDHAQCAAKRAASSWGGAAATTPAHSMAASRLVVQAELQGCEHVAVHVRHKKRELLLLLLLLRGHALGAAVPSGRAAP